METAKNEMLCRVGPGTPMGNLLRRYWMPIAGASELETNPVKAVRLFGENLVLFRDEWAMQHALEKGAERLVFCVDRKTGNILWQKSAWKGEPEPVHIMNGWASATCVTDGQIVVAFFGRGGMHAYTVDGEHLWSKDLGKFESPWGVSACPILVDDMVVQNCDADVDAFITALDKRTGKELWRFYTTPAAGEPGDESWNVLELSSFQLETTDTFRAHIGAALNVTPDHLDRHYTLEILFQRVLFVMT